MKLKLRDGPPDSKGAYWSISKHVYYNKKPRWIYIAMDQFCQDWEHFSQEKKPESIMT